MSMLRERGGPVPAGTAGTPGTAATDDPGACRFRPDIQGLRAVAILLVVLGHAGFPGLRGGYAGVDVFFVISGYLVTRQLTGEAVSTGRISLATFYLTRVRRLLPSAVLVIVVTLILARIYAPPPLTRSLSLDGIFAALYVLNDRLAAQGVDYRTVGATPSALEHFWALSVAAQLYVLWPLLFLAALALTRRWWRDLVPALVLAVTLISLYVSQHLLAADASMSYFAVQSRAWEFGLGAMVALASGLIARLRPRIRGVLLLAGLVLIIGAGFAYDAATAFPGLNALVPVAGAALVISAGCGTPLRAGAILGRRVLRWLGDVSYPWYLWHWPILVLAPRIWPQATFSWTVKLGLVMFALLPAAVNYYALQVPLRKPRFRRSVWAATGLVLLAVAVVTGTVIDANVSPLIPAPAPRPVAARPLPAPAAGAGNTAGNTAGSAAANAAVADPFAGPRTSGPVTPVISKAPSDTPGYPADCIVSYPGTASPTCLIDQYGSATSAPIGTGRVVLLGDDHAGQWYPDVFGLAHSRGWDTEVLNKGGCPLASIPLDNDPQCARWRAGTIQRLRSEPRPQVIFIASLTDYGAGAALASGWKTTMAALGAIGAPIVYLRDTPYPGADIPSCVAGALSDWARCSFARTAAFPPDPLMTGTAASHGLAARVDVDQYLCPPPAARCPAVLGGTLLYRDNSHVTNTAMSMLAPVVEQQLVQQRLQPFLPSVAKPGA